MADVSQFSIVTYERGPRYWRAAITPHAHAGMSIKGKTTNSFVTPDDSASESEANSAAANLIGKL